MTGLVPNVYAAIIIPMPAAALALVLRIKARRMTRMGLGYDDALCIAAWVFAVAYSVDLIVWAACFKLGQRLAPNSDEKIDYYMEKSRMMLWASEYLMRLPFGQKIAVLGLFALGSLVGIASIFQIIQSQTYNPKTRELPYEFAMAMVWGSVEVHLAVFTSCLALLRPIFRKVIPGLSSGNSYAASRPRTIPLIQSVG
ncbi:hypothetical protein LRP88_10907 [Fusarium phalaenopsidis]